MSITMLLVSVLMLTGASFAWVLSVDEGTVGNMKITADVDAVVAMSYNAKNWTSTAFDTLTMDDLKNAYEGNTNLLPENNVEPISCSGQIALLGQRYQLALYSGRIQSDSLGNITSFESSYIEDPTTSSAFGNYFAFDLFLHANELAGDVTFCLKPGSEVAISRSSANYNVAFDLSNAVRVAFVFYGTTQHNTNDLLNMQLNPQTANVVIWEPNALEHNADSGVADGLFSPTFALNAIGNVNVNDKTNSNTALKQMNHSVQSIRYVPTASGFEHSVPLFQLPVGYSKVRVYVWIEGQDEDCSIFSAGVSVATNLCLGVESPANDSETIKNVSFDVVSNCERFGCVNSFGALISSEKSVADFNNTTAVNGYVFQGWYANKQGTIPATGNVCDYSTLYAKFVPA